MSESLNIGGPSMIQILRASVVTNCCEKKKPAEHLLQRALFPVSVLTSSAPHPRRRAVRVMVVVMVPIQHEIRSYATPVSQSIPKIR
jgi:hypothetical protein